MSDMDRERRHRALRGPGNFAETGGEHASWYDAPDVDDDGPDLGDLVVILLGATLAAMADQLASDGFEQAAELVGDLLAAVDDYTSRLT